MESTIENYFRKQVIRHLKGLPLKLTSPSMNGLPDRIVLLPGGKIFFVELKDRGKKARPLQLVVHGILQRLGFKVYVIDSKEQVDEVIIWWNITNPTTTKT